MTANSFPRITFGLIVLNGQPFVRYNLRALYPFAHQIVVVEGAVPGAASIATENGHSLDGTLEELARFKREEDPENILEIVTKDGFWSEKDEMSQAYAARATGDYLWQVDVDEFYQPADMHKVMLMLKDDAQIAAVYFKQITFWGGFDYVADGWYLRQKQGEGPGIVPRVFQWRDGYRYATHRPVTVVDRDGRAVNQLKSLDGRELASQGIFMYHYALVFPEQVALKSAYYSQADWVAHKEMNKWAEEVYEGLNRPYRVHNVYHYPSWLENFQGKHPPQIIALRQDIAGGHLEISLRETEDIERLLESPFYRFGRRLLKLADPVARNLLLLRRRIKQLINPP